VIGIGVHGWLLWLCCGKERGSRLGGAGVHANLVKVTFVHGHGLGWIFANGGRCEAGPRGKVSSVDGNISCREGRRENARVVEGDASCTYIMS
jgi:hypothetical protein